MLACCSSARALGDTGWIVVLPFDVQWNGTTLPAGPYHFTLSSAPWDGVLLVRDGRQNGKLLAMPIGLGKKPDRSALTIVKRKGKWYVASVALQDRDATLEYWVPPPGKAEGEMEASIQVIDVRIVRG